MSDQPISEIVGRHDAAAPVTGSVGEVAPPTPLAGETSGTEAAKPVDDTAGLKSALDKERALAKSEGRERKKLAQQLANYERELHTLKSQVNKPDPKAREDEFWTGSPPEYFDKRFSEYEQRQQEAATRERVETSKEYARDRYEDFEDVEAAFLEAAQKDPSLWQGVTESRAPALAVYKKGKAILAGGVTSPDARIAKLEAELAEMRAGRDGGQTSDAAETAAAPAQKPTIPRSNVGVRGSGVGKSSSWAGPTPIGNVFGRQRRATR